eukprot:TRINITY_DN24398_c0_g1_i1.p1 TRINITY_DN24398_c0_g1~~TRINITY_DN24398_c0_g1_i1.p1  ORF type:complete len:643 (+),score=139.61 TRINITY_DN24398_c0_g1_i1:120-2048(+)
MAMDVIQAAWASWCPEERERVMRVEEPEAVRLIGTNMRQLWTAEIQARNIGVKGPVHPFDSGQLPLLSTMQFDTKSDQQNDDGSATLQCVKWPQGFHQDPSLLPGAIRSALQPGSSTAGGATSSQGRKTPKAMRPQKWHELLEPPAQSWVGFERQLALLVEQLVLHAADGQKAAKGSSLKTGTSATAALHGEADAGAALIGGGDAKEVLGDDSGDDDEGGLQNGHEFATARAAKRARQRERRRQGKALAREAAAVAEVTGSAVRPSASSAGGTASIANAMPVSVPLESLATPRPPGSNACSPTLGPSVPGAAMASLPEPAVVRVPSAGKELNGLPLRSSPSVEGENAALDGEEGGSPDHAGPENGGDVERPRSDLPMLAGFGGIGWGLGTPMGQGRPINGQMQAPVGLTPHGRGRALEPPPGLQGLNLSKSQMPASLSQPWMPGPAIPEDDEDLQDAAASVALQMAWHLPEGFNGDGTATPGSFYDRTPSYWSKNTTPRHCYAPTPIMDWAKTPSSPATPALGPAAAAPLPAGLAAAARKDSDDSPRRIVSEQLTVAAQQQAAAAAALASEQQHYSQGCIPMYVTVPLAHANTCPHCGHLFAMMSPNAMGGKGGMGAPVQDFRGGHDDDASTDDVIRAAAKG